MNVDRHNFLRQVLPIVSAIASADFVAIDFEFSGVSGNILRPGGRALATLQHRYDEVKAAADKYQILQVGITTAQLQQQQLSQPYGLQRLDSLRLLGGYDHEDSTENCGKTGGEQTFELKTWNINLCPIIEEELGVNRDFILQSGAAEFLLKNRFDFHSLVAHGVRYLSRKEALEAFEHAEKRSDPRNFFEVRLKPEDTEALAFVHRVRTDVRQWISTGESGKKLFISSRLDQVVEKETLVSDDVVASSPCDAANTRSTTAGNAMPTDLSAHTAATKPAHVNSLLSHNSTALSPSRAMSKFDRKLVHQLLRAEFPAHAARLSGLNLVVTRIDPARQQQAVENRQQRVMEQINQTIGFRWIIEALCGGDVQGMMNSLALPLMNTSGTFSWLDAPSNAFATQHDKDVLMKKLKQSRPVLVGHNVFCDLMYMYQTFLGDLPERVEDFASQVKTMFPLVIDTKYMATEEFDYSNSSALDQISECLKNEQEPKIYMHPEFNKYNGKEALHEAGYDSYQTARIAILLSAKLKAGDRLGTYTPFLHPPRYMTSTPIQSDSDARTCSSSNSSPGGSNSGRSSLVPSIATSILKLPSREMPLFEGDKAFWKRYGNRLRIYGTVEKYLELTNTTPHPQATATDSAPAANATVDADSNDYTNAAAAATAAAATRDVSLGMDVELGTATRGYEDSVGAGTREYDSQDVGAAAAAANTSSTSALVAAAATAAAFAPMLSSNSSSGSNGTRETPQFIPATRSLRR